MKNETIMRMAEVLQTTDKKQGREHLCRRQDDGTYAFCCMGVMSDELDIPHTELESGAVAYNGCFAFPPAMLFKRLGFDGFSGKAGTLFLDAAEYRDREDHPLDLSLDQLNDILELTFAQIGDLIAYFGLLTRRPRAVGSSGF